MFKLLKAYSLIVVITFAQLFIGFLLLDVKYAFLIALLTAFVDILPVLGTGTAVSYTHLHRARREVAEDGFLVLRQRLFVGLHLELAAERRMLLPCAGGADVFALPEEGQRADDRHPVSYTHLLTACTVEYMSEQMANCDRHTPFACPVVPEVKISTCISSFRRGISSTAFLSDAFLTPVRSITSEKRYTCMLSAERLSARSSATQIAAQAA